MAVAQKSPCVHLLLLLEALLTMSGKRVVVKSSSKVQ